MRTSKEELISNELKPIICQKIKDARIKFGYSLEDLAKALNYQKNRQKDRSLGSVNRRDRSYRRKAGEPR
mgnify:CR=1 FL=1